MASWRGQPRHTCGRIAPGQHHALRRARLPVPAGAHRGRARRRATVPPPTRIASACARWAWDMGAGAFSGNPAAGAIRQRDAAVEQRSPASMSPMAARAAGGSREPGKAGGRRFIVEQRGVAIPAPLPAGAMPSPLVRGIGIMLTHHHPRPPDARRRSGRRRRAHEMTGGRRVSSVTDRAWTRPASSGQVRQAPPPRAWGRPPGWVHPPRCHPALIHHQRRHAGIGARQGDAHAAQRAAAAYPVMIGGERRSWGAYRPRDLRSACPSQFVRGVFLSAAASGRRVQASALGRSDFLDIPCPPLPRPGACL